MKTHVVNSPLDWLPALFFLSALTASSQQASVSGTMLSNGIPLKDAVIQLMTVDSSLFKTEILNDDGHFSFAGINPGQYFIYAANPGYKPYTSPLLSLKGDTSLPAIQVEKTETTLKEVTVTAKKPFIERQRGMVVLHPDQSVTLAGASVFEVIQKSPGVRIDNNDNISMNGRPGTMVWIDGKPAQLTGAELANFLRGIPADAIEKVELISNPPASYDAAGNAIIHIRMKKDKRLGTNATVTSSYGQGIYPKISNTINFNHRNKKVNIFGTYSHALRKGFSHLRLNREFSVRDSFIGAFHQDNYSAFEFNTHTARAGMDYSFSKRTTLGVVMSGVDNRLDRLAKNVSDVFNSQYAYASLFRTASNNANHWSNYSGNVNLRHEFDSLGTTLAIDVDVARFGNKSVQDIETRYYDPQMSEFRLPYLLYGDLNGLLEIAAVKTDFNRSFKNGMKAEAGHKSSYVAADNNLAFYDRSSGMMMPDTTKSNHFIYRENINAAYVTISKEYARWSYRLGLRAEQTVVNGLQLTDGSTFSRNYTQLFPNVLLSWKANRENSLELTYSRRIRRPNYDQLNPFKFYLDPTTYREGYPFLSPSATESFEFTHTFRDRIYTSVGFGRTYDNLIEVIAPLTEEQRVTVQTTRNLSMVDVYTLNGAIPLDVTKWWTTSTDFNLYYAFYSGNIADTRLSARGGLNAGLNTTNTFKLPFDISLELTGAYQAREIYAYDVIEPIWSGGAGLQKKLFSNRGTLRLSITDIFYTNRVRAKVTYTDYDEQFLVERDSRVATASFSYRFGKSTVPAARRRQGGADDLKQRASEGAG
jgi:hypothetical protein